MHLLELLEYCKAKNYNVLFTRFPHRVENREKYQRYCEGNYIADLVKEYGFAYLDCEHVLDTIGIDRIDDFADGEHLRADGAKLLTEYIGKVLIEQYGITQTMLNVENRQRWDRCVNYINGFFFFFSQVKDGESDLFLYENNSLMSKIEELFVNN